MSFLIIVRSGAHTGRCIWLREGQTVQFGRTDLADCSLDGDESMSRLHFAVDLQHGQCRIRDLGSRNGTYVNDQLVRMHLLSHGDRVMAGKTEFEVVLDQSLSEKPDSGEPAKKTDSWNAERLWAKANSKSGFATITDADQESELEMTREFSADLDELEEIPPRAIVPPAAAQFSSPAAQSPPEHWHDSTMIVPSGRESEHASYYQMALSDAVTAYCASPSQIRPIELGRMLFTNQGARLLINVERMDAEAQSFFSSSVHGRRFGRIDESHILISGEDGLDMLELFRRSWGRDAAVLMLSRAATSEIRQHIAEKRDSFGGPSILWAELRRSSPTDQKRLLGPIDVIVVEDNGSYEWAILVATDANITWQNLGLSSPPRTKK